MGCVFSIFIYFRKVYILKNMDMNLIVMLDNVGYYGIYNKGLILKEKKMLDSYRQS